MQPQQQQNQQSQDCKVAKPNRFQYFNIILTICNGVRG